MSASDNKSHHIVKPANPADAPSSALSEVEQESIVVSDDEKEVSDRYPKSNRILTAITLSVMGAGMYALDKLLTMFDEVLAVPYSYVLEFYNITLLVPTQTLPKVWVWLSALELTSNPDVNLGISAVAIFLYWAVVFGVYSLWVELIGIMIARLGNYDRPDVVGAFQLYLFPALLVILFFLIINVFLLYGDNSVFQN